MNSLCQQLDDYLGGELHGVDASEFNEHLNSCARCREVVEIAHDIDERLKMDWNAVRASNQLRDKIAADLADIKPTMVTRTVDRKRMASVIAAALTTAAAVYALSSVPAWLDKPKGERVTIATPVSPEGEETNGLLDRPAVVTFPLVKDTESSIVVPQVTEARYTIVRAYPAYTKKAHAN